MPLVRQVYIVLLPNKRVTHKSEELDIKLKTLAVSRMHTPFPSGILNAHFNENIVFLHIKH